MPKPSLFVAVTFALLCNAVAAQSVRELPNIILVTVDDLGWTDLACYGSEFYETPNIDALARDGMRFTNAYASCALCSPTRASLMTGRYPTRTGITDWIRASFQPGGKPGENLQKLGFEEVNGKPLHTPVNPLRMELAEITIAELLKTRGYATCHIGKWHLGGEGFYPTDQGFDENHGGCDFGEPPSYFDPYRRAAMPKLNYDPIPNIPTLPKRKAGEYLTDREADHAVEFIARHRSKPFFLNLSHYAVHVPIQARSELTKKYEAKPKTHHSNAKYAAMIESVDQCLGRVRAELAKWDLTQNTLVLFTSDNGGLVRGGVTSNSPLRNGKATPYEGGIRIPLIAAWPEEIGSEVASSIPVCSIDLLPTLCDVTNVPLPTDRAIDGVSLLPVLFSERTSMPRTLFWHYPHYRVNEGMVPYSIILRHPWKLIRFYEGEYRYELYNVVEDVGERTNLAAADDDRVQSLVSELDAWLRNTNAKMPKQ